MIIAITIISTYNLFTGKRYFTSFSFFIAFTEQTPKMLEMEDGDQIDCVVYQEGGMC
jgi:hypothetical protein